MSRMEVTGTIGKNAIYTNPIYKNAIGKNAIVKRTMGKPVIDPIALVAAALGAIFCSTASAHHSYAAYDRCKTFTVAGTIERVSWANPHVVFTLETDDGRSYLIQWLDVARLARDGVSSADLKVGDTVIVSGSANRDPDVRIVTLLTAVSRPSDGWKWERPPTSAGRCKA